MLAEEDVTNPLAPPATGAGRTRKSSGGNNLVRNAFAILQAFRGSDDWLTSRDSLI